MGCRYLRVGLARHLAPRHSRKEFTDLRCCSAQRTHRTDLEALFQILGAILEGDRALS